MIYVVTPELDAGPVLDMMVAVRLGWSLRVDDNNGWRSVVRPDGHCCDWFKDRVYPHETVFAAAYIPKYSQSLEEAQKLIDHEVQAGSDMAMTRSHLSDDYLVTFARVDGASTVRGAGVGKTIAVAVCKALLDGLVITIRG